MSSGQLLSVAHHSVSAFDTVRKESIQTAAAGAQRRAVLPLPVKYLHASLIRI